MCDNKYIILTYEINSSYFPNNSTVNHKICNRYFIFVIFYSLFNFFFVGFLGFEKLTHIPIQKKLIDVSLLTDIEINWLNTYHSEIFTKVGPLMMTDLGRKWLRESTNPLVKPQ